MATKRFASQTEFYRPDHLLAQERSGYMMKEESRWVAIVAMAAADTPHHDY